jgi:glucose-1-phosphate thymidylyltransferase
MTGSIVLFEDQFVDDMQPITLTRPAFGVTCACCNLYEIASSAADHVSYIVRDYLEKVARRRYDSNPPASGPTLMLNASVAPDVCYVDVLQELLEEGEPFLCTSGQRVAAALMPPEQTLDMELGPGEVTPYLLRLNLPLREEEILRTFDYPFHVVKAQEDLFAGNLQWRIANGQFEEVESGVFLGDGVSVADTAVLHAEDGFIVLDEDVQVFDLAYLQGPLYVGPRSRIIERASVKEFTCIGHTCKIGGEVEVASIEPYTNKQHHGFLGHAYIGSWVNMGAGTSNSDLKNTYGEVRVDHRGKRMDTGMQFLGCIMGDFCKTAINTSIFTGKIIGVGSMLYGYVGQNVPSFTNFAKSFGQVTESSLEQAIITQKRMFARRDVEQTEDDIALLTKVFELTQEERRISSELPVL